MKWQTMMATSLVAGGLANSAVAGPLNTNLVDNPSFEDDSVWVSNGGTIATYLYSQGYTSINVPPSPGLRYGTGQLGTASTTTVQTIDLVLEGFTAAELDSSLSYDLSGYFSSYLSQNDNTAITANFLDSVGGTLLGSSASIGGLAFVSALGTAPNIDGIANHRDWGQDATTGVIPFGTRAVEIRLLTTRLAGSAADGYVDLVDFQVVPEPATYLVCGLAGLMGGAALLRRRRLQAA
jgi:hypothetical protein